MCFKGQEERSINSNHDPPLPFPKLVRSPHHEQRRQAPDNGEGHDDVDDEVIPTRRNGKRVNKACDTDGE